MIPVPARGRGNAARRVRAQAPSNSRILRRRRTRGLLEAACGRRVTRPVREQAPSNRWFLRGTEGCLLEAACGRRVARPFARNPPSHSQNHRRARPKGGSAGSRASSLQQAVLARHRRLPVGGRLRRAKGGLAGSRASSLQQSSLPPGAAIAGARGRRVMSVDHGHRPRRRGHRGRSADGRWADQNNGGPSRRSSRGVIVPR